MNEHEFLLQDRLQKIKDTVEQYGEDRFYISFSGGKDSTVMSSLFDMAIPGNTIPRIFADTGIEMNHIRDFVRQKAEQDDRVVMIRPSIPITTMLQEKGYPFKSKQHSHVVGIYQRHGMNSKTVQKYLYSDSRYTCPKVLRYQFTSEFNMKLSHDCCNELKKKPIKKWAKENKKNCVALGLRAREGGNRENVHCVAIRGRQVTFNPLVMCTDEWMEWVISTYHIEICDLYKPPYNFHRTGCKGCPFAIDLQHNLDALGKYFPAERNQCELIWKPVYDEYRRLHYRLKDRE